MSASIANEVMLIIILRFLCGEYYLGDEDALRVWAEQVSVRVVMVGRRLARL